MPEADELKRRARRAESRGEFREALERYRAALDEEQKEDDEVGDPGLLLRIGDLHARLSDREAALAAYVEASDQYARQGLVTNAVAVCNKILRSFPDQVECHRRLAELQREMGLVAEARGSLRRYLEAADGGDLDPGRAADAARDFLEDEPDQEVALEAARLLDRRDRTGEAVDLLRIAWEKRTGRRQPAGAIESLAQRLDPAVDLASWTPEWPPRGADDRAAPEKGRETADAREGGSVPEPAGAAADGREAPSPGPSPGAGPGTDRLGTDARETDASRTDAPEPDAPETEGDGGLVRTYARARGASGSGGEGPSRRLRQRGNGGGDRGGGPEPGDGGPDPAGGGPDPGGAGGDRGAPGNGRGGAGPGASAEAARAAGEDAALRRGLEVLEDLLALDDDAPELRRRKVAYARRLGEPELLEEALVELGDVLVDAGASRGARLVYEEVLERLNPSSDAAAAGLRRVEAREERPAGVDAAHGATADGTDAATDGAAAAGPADADGEAGSPAPDDGADDAFRRRLGRALDRAPRELARLQAAGRDASSAGAAVPWTAHRELGRYLLLRERPEAAVEHLATARRRGPREGEGAADLLYHLGLAHRRAGDAEAARRCFRRLAERDPGFATAWRALSP